MSIFMTIMAISGIALWIGVIGIIVLIHLEMKDE
jgi:hypothetical protein